MNKRSRKRAAMLGIALTGIAITLAWSKSRYEQSPELALPPRAAPAPGEPLNYKLPEDHTLPPEVARWLSPKMRASNPVYYDLTSQGATLAKLMTPLPKAILQDPLQSLSPPAGLKGTLIYAVSAIRLNQPPSGDFLVKLHLDNGATSVTTYPLAAAADDYIMEPRFVDDGQRVLFKLGWPFDRAGQYQLYLLDAKAQKLQRLTTETLANENVQVSADGNYIAYVRGGDRFGSNGGSRSPFGMQDVSPQKVTPLQLFILNVKTGKEHLVVANDTIAAGRYAWTPRDTLLYSVIPPRPEPSDKNKPADTAPQRRNIYEVAGAGGAAKLIMHDGWRPLSSPDGKRIAFFGAEIPEKPEPLSRDWRDVPQGATLCVANSDGTARKALNRENGNYPNVFWQGDNFLLMLKTGQNGAVSVAMLRKIDVDAARLVSTVDLVAQDNQPLPRPVGMLPPFRILGLSGDGLYVFAQVEEYGEQDEVTKMYNRRYTLLAINTKSGQIFAVCKLKNAFGLDWHDESEPLQNPARTP